MEGDWLATLAYNCDGVGHTQSSSPVFQEEAHGVFIHGTKVTSKPKQRVIDKCGDDQQRHYLQNKHNLSEGKVDGVNWPALWQYLKSLTPLCHALQIKLQHNWIPTKGFLFLQGRETCDQRSLCQQAVKTACHVHQCQAPGATQFRSARLATLTRALCGINTAPEI